MLSVVKRLLSRNNPTSLVAQACGLLCGGLVPFLVTLALLRWLQGSIAVIWTAYALNSCLTLIGCVYVIGMRRIGSYVNTFQGFMREFRFAFTTALLMPILVGAAVVILLMGLRKDSPDAGEKGKR